MMNISKIKVDRQDRESVAWLKLNEYIELIAANGDDKFAPKEYLGSELFSQIYTLPPSIEKLDQVKTVILYGSNLVSIPPQIEEMKSLETFTPYTSYSLCWFPYEIIYCFKLKSSTVSTRALYGNFKNKKIFPDLSNNPARNANSTVKCSICEKETNYEQIRQYWVSVLVATDVLPLLANLCSFECGKQLAEPAINYIQYPHRGGLQPKPMEEIDFK